MQIPLSTHQSLLARLSAGADQTAWAEFAHRYGELIRGFARRRGLQAADVEDMLQEVCVALSKGMRDFVYQPSRGRFRGYLKTIAVRSIGKHLRKHGGPVLEAEAEPALADPEIEANWEAEWRQHHLRTAMQGIGAEFRATDVRAFELLTQGGADAKAVAGELGISVDSAYQAKSRILKRLRELIKAQVEDEG